MNFEAAIAKLEAIEKQKEKYNNIEESKQMYRLFFRERNSNLLTRFLYSLMIDSKIEWVQSYISDDVISFIENDKDLNSRVRLYNTLIYFYYATEQESKTIFYANKLLRMDDNKLMYFTNSYQLAIATLLTYDMFEEAKEFAERILKRLEKFGMPKEAEFCAYINSYQVFSNLNKPNKKLVNDLEKKIEKMLEDENFRKKYGFLYDFLRLEGEWKSAIKSDSLKQKKYVADQISNKLKFLIAQKELNINGTNSICEILEFYSNNHFDEEVLSLEEPLFGYFKTQEMRMKLYAIYANYYDFKKDIDKAYNYYKMYCSGMLEKENQMIKTKQSRFRDIFNETKLSIENETLQKTIMFDEATGCYSKEYLKTIFNNPFYGSLILIDLDGLKRINDQFGHLYGDQYIAYFSKNLLDYANVVNGKVYRFGGDEFVLTLPTINKEEVVSFIEKIYKDFSIPQCIGEHSFNIPFSAGITICNNKILYQAFDEADQAMYRMKALSKNSYSFY